MQNMYIIISKQNTSEDVKTSLSEKYKTAVLCTELLKQKRTKVIESPSSY